MHMKMKVTCKLALLELDTSELWNMKWSDFIFEYNQFRDSNLPVRME